jgi:outer membrane protein assembly factor BamB
LQLGFTKEDQPMRRFLAFCVLLLTSTVGRADDWPQWLGIHRDGASKETVKPWKEPLKIAWTQPVGEGHGGPVVAGAKVYLHARTPGKNEEVLAVFDAATGKPAWSTTYPRAETKIPFGNGPRGAPCVEGGKVYTYGISGILTCYDANADKIIWQNDVAKQYNPPALTFGCSCSPIVVDDNVIINVGAKGASIVAFDKNTGKEVWKALSDGATYSSPITITRDKTQQLIFLTAKGLVSLAPKDGSVYWQQPLVDLLLESSTTPVVVGDILFGSSITFGGLGAKLEDMNGKPAIKKLWTNSNLNCYFATPVSVDKDSLYMVTGSLFKKTAVLHCVNPADGKILWTKGKVGTYHASLLRTGDNKILMVEEPGDLVLLEHNREKYTELSRSKICGSTWAHPALANGRLYIRDAKNLVCVEMAK